jgi:hypothetical protein
MLLNLRLATGPAGLFQRLIVAFLLTGVFVAELAAAPNRNLQIWLYCAQNLAVDENVDELEKLFHRAARAGYTHVLLSDSKFGRLSDMDSHYFRNVERVKKLAEQLHLSLVPALFPIGYSNDLLWHNPNLVEALPVRDARFVVRDGTARLQADPQVQLKGGDFSDLSQWNWKDPTVTADEGAARIKDPKGQNSRIVQSVKLSPFRQYHLAVRIKTANFVGTAEAKVIAGEQTLNYNHLGVKPTQGWAVHHVTFNSLDHTNASIYLGCWDGQSGSLWFDDAHLEEVGLLNLVRRDGAPLVVQRQDRSTLAEGVDCDPVVDPKMGNHPWKGAYDVWHEPPLIRARVANGTVLRVSYFHAVTVHEDQAMICPSERLTIELLRDQARRMHGAWGAKGYMMSHDEIRVLNWCAACEKRHLDAGALLADNVRACAAMLRQINPGGAIYVWSDMFDPNHNAVDKYYLVRGNLRGSWEGLEKDVIVVPWHFEKRKESLRWFADRGHRQLIAGYYDHRPEQVQQWLESTGDVRGILGVMYTTWQRKYQDLEKFAELIRKAP